MPVSRIAPNWLKQNFQTSLNSAGKILKQFEIIKQTTKVREKRKKTSKKENLQHEITRQIELITDEKQWLWLRRGQLKREMEFFIIAAQKKTLESIISKQKQIKFKEKKKSLLWEKRLDCKLYYKKVDRAGPNAPQIRNVYTLVIVQILT